jgi:hypothetical protein
MPQGREKPRCKRLLEEARSRFGVILVRVKRLQETLVPRSRPAPDGCKSGGTQSTNISVINHCLWLAPALPMDSINWEENVNEKNCRQRLTSEVISTTGGSAAGGGTTTNLRLADDVGAAPLPTHQLQPLVRP